MGDAVDLTDVGSSESILKPPAAVEDPLCAGGGPVDDCCCIGRPDKNDDAYGGSA